jgi:hypothetical protein
MIELESECQLLGETLVEESDKEILTSWCHEHLDSKIVFLRNVEQRVTDLEIEAHDSVSNVSKGPNKYDSESLLSARMEAAIRRKELELELEYRRRRQSN